MKISRNWLNNYIISRKTDSELVDAFTSLGLECTIQKNSLIDSNIVVGKVKNCIKHPNADRLKLCKVDIGQKRMLTIVCGAPNIRKNIMVPVAKVGSKIGNFTIKKTKIRDALSEGMICSGKELGLNDDHNGIMILDNNLKKGEELNKSLSLNESIFDFDITPNRGDCFSHLGISRELSIIENKKINIEQVNLRGNNFSTRDLIKVNVRDEVLCPRYACRIIRNIKVEESPQWLKNKLALIGHKSINNIVDLANYIMFDLGQPLHTFDYDKLNGNAIEVRLAKKNEEILCLNNELNKLSINDIVIADSKGPVAIAGVIGGLNSQVDDNTKNILIESAVFNEINIRKTAKKYEYAKEASKRFERGVDYDNVIYAMDKFSKILLDIVGGELSYDFIDVTKRKYGISKNKNSNLRKINFNSKSCNDFLGINLNKNDFKKIFSKLSIDIDVNKNDYICTVPSYRNDLEREVDIYEEVARVFGYDNIPSDFDFTFSSKNLVLDENLLEDKIRFILSSNGFNEHYSNSLYSEIDAKFINTKPINIKNPLSQDMAFLRNSLVPGILKALSYNEKRDSRFLKYYEIGSINLFSNKKNNSSIENRELCIAYLGNKIKSWKKEDSFDLFDVKGDLKMLFNNIGIKKVSYNLKNDDFLSILAKDKKIGKLFHIDNDLRKEYDIQNDAILVIVDLYALNQLYRTKKNKYQKIIPYPMVYRDIAFLVNSTVRHSEIEKVIFSSSKSILKDVNLFDIYEGEDLTEGAKSMAYSLKFQSSSKTLTIDEVDKEMKKIMGRLKTKFNASQR